MDHLDVFVSKLDVTYLTENYLIMNTGEHPMKV